MSSEELRQFKRTLDIEIKTWELAKAKGECNEWGEGYIRGLEVAKEFLDNILLAPLVMKGDK